MIKDDLLLKYDAAVEALIVMVNKATIDELAFSPKNVDDWSINEHIIHIVFCESESFARYLFMDRIKKEIITVKDSKSWIKNIAANSFSQEIITNYLRNQKNLMISLLNSEDDSSFTHKFVTCIYNDEDITVTLQENIESSIEHIDFHMDYINRIRDEYQEHLHNEKQIL